MALRRLVRACLILIPFCATSPAWAQCISPEAGQALMKKRNVGAFIVADLKGQDAKDFWARFNAIPPPSNSMSDRLQVYYKRGRASVFIIAYIGGCYAGSARLRVDLFRAYWPLLSAKLDAVSI